MLIVGISYFWDKFRGSISFSLALGEGEAALSTFFWVLQAVLENKQKYLDTRLKGGGYIPTLCEVTGQYIRPRTTHWVNTCKYLLL